MSEQNLKRLIIGLTCIAIAGMLFVSPIPQDPHYHEFADRRTLLSIPYFWNVISNFGFLYVGVLGLYKLYRVRSLKIIEPIKLSYAVFLLGVTLVAFGSGYYHWTPSNETLLWDRLPMTLAFMALLSIVLAEFLSVSWGRKAVVPLLFVGLASALYWYWGEQHGQGDLRAYVLVQFLPIVLILIMVACGRNVFNTSAGYWALTVCYVLAKLLEHFDGAIYNISAGVMAGHAMKHVIAALGLYFLLRSFEGRVLEHEKQSIG